VRESLCVACGSDISVDLGRTELRIEWCSTCGTGKTIPPPGRDQWGDEIFQDPRGGYPDRLAHREQWIYEAKTRLGWVRPFFSDGASLLEIGAATGEFVSAAERSGLAVRGLETSAWAAENAKSITSSVTRLDLAAMIEADPAMRADAVVMFHTLEHIAEPSEFLNLLASITSPGAMLFIEVPNGGSSGAKSEGPDWYAARLWDHYYHYTSRGLVTLLGAHGFKAVDSSEYPRTLYSPASGVSRLKHQLRNAPQRLLGNKPSLDLLRVRAVRDESS
jgi:hypothetical protein